MLTHPANDNNPRLHVFLWRYFTGAHLDGRPRTNASWTRKGTVPSHHVNWWNSKPRLHRMVWRWLMVVIPVGWIIAYKLSPTYGINLTVFITLCCLPYILHHGIYKLVRMLPRHTVVFVHDNVHVEDVDTDLDDIAIPEQIHKVDDIQAILDNAVDDATKPNRRRS